MLQSDPYGNLVTEVRLTCEYLLDSPWQFLGWGVLEQIARSAGLKCRRHEGWVVMHAEDKNLRPRVTQSDPSNQRQATKIPCTHLKIDHHRVGMAPVVESVAGHEVTSFENRLNSSILEGTPASRKDDRMIINHENASHSPLRRRSLRANAARRSPPPMLRSTIEARTQPPSHRRCNVGPYASASHRFGNRYNLNLPCVCRLPT